MASILRRPVDLLFVSIFASFAVIAVTIGKLYVAQYGIVTRVLLSQTSYNRPTGRYWKRRRSSMALGLQPQL